MIENDICAYCRVKLNKQENHPHCRSIEHLIPNTATTFIRNNNEGDFCVCRKCNSMKSKLDEVLGKCSKIQGGNDLLALQTINDEINKNSEIFKKLKKAEVVKSQGRIMIRLPLTGRGLIDYMTFLGKGQFLKDTREIFNSDKYVMKYSWFNKLLLMEFEDYYKIMFNSSNLQDLRQNLFTEKINGGECMIHSINRSYLFIFNDYMAIGIKILNNSKKNRAISQESKNKILKAFPFK